MKAYKRSLNSSTLLGKEVFLNDFSSSKNSEGFFKHSVHDSSNEDISDLNAMKTNKMKNSCGKHNAFMDNTDSNTKSRTIDDMSSTALKQSERTLHRQSEVKDRMRNQKGDHIGTA